MGVKVACHNRGRNGKYIDIIDLSFWSPKNKDSEIRDSQRQHFQENQNQNQNQNQNFNSVNPYQPHQTNNSLFTYNYNQHNQYYSQLPSHPPVDHVHQYHQPLYINPIYGWNIHHHPQNDQQQQQQPNNIQDIITTAQQLSHSSNTFTPNYQHFISVQEINLPDQQSAVGPQFSNEYRIYQQPVINTNIQQSIPSHYPESQQPTTNVQLIDQQPVIQQPVIQQPNARQPVSDYQPTLDHQLIPLPHPAIHHYSPNSQQSTNAQVFNVLSMVQHSATTYYPLNKPQVVSHPSDQKLIDQQPATNDASTSHHLSINYIINHPTGNLTDHQIQIPLAPPVPHNISREPILSSNIPTDNIAITLPTTTDLHPDPQPNSQISLSQTTATLIETSTDQINRTTQRRRESSSQPDYRFKRTHDV
ncbi:uncharacterized protein ASCRUDRAFT_7169 [Ascoidea rubescens DSM 1968]|nr:hypothetical protein ASCRUDRAFT_7169 [Ascoidea rubescens DSM 1968]ODV62626.1 hypothetical protein ASCRUDRAFT_7169 [Ascoidea rubescens DSM 1968]